LADVGFEVICVDIDQEKNRTTQKGKSPIYEPGLEEMLERNIQKGRITFTTSLVSILDDVEVIFFA
jgi:UDPglucose 6-dehydrogenase